MTVEFSKLGDDEENVLVGISALVYYTDAIVCTTIITVWM